MFYIPKTVKAGFNNRNDTYSGKLAYVIPLGKDGKWRKEKSWLGWIEKDMGVQEFENEPIEGFVLNKKVGDYKSDWNHRQAYSRVYDPRGFEFEITIDNLLFILECSASIPGKALGGKFVYAWSGKDLILLPENSLQYKENLEFSRMADVKIGARDLKEGYTYTTPNKEQYLFIGRYNCKCHQGRYRYGSTILQPYQKNAFVFVYKDQFEAFKSCPKFIAEYNGNQDIGPLKYKFMESPYMSKIVKLEAKWTEKGREKVIIRSDSEIEKHWYDPYNYYNYNNTKYFRSYKAIYTLDNNCLNINNTHYRCNESSYYWDRKYPIADEFITLEEYNSLGRYEVFAVLESGEKVKI